MRRDWKLGARLRLKPETIIAWAHKGRIPARRLSRKVIRFSESEVTAGLEARDRGNSTPEPTKGASHERRPSDRAGDSPVPEWRRYPQP